MPVPNQVLDFNRHMSFSLVFKWEMIVRFVEIDWTADYMNFLFLCWDCGPSKMSRSEFYRHCLNRLQYNSIVIIQWLNINKLTLANTEGAIENEKCRETGNIGYEEKQNKKYNTICVGHYYTKANTHNVNKTWALLQCQLITEDLSLTTS